MNSVLSSSRSAARPASAARTRWALAAGTALALLSTACATPEQRAAYAQRQIEVAMNTFGPACDKLGFQRGTDPWRDCVLKLYNQDQAQQTAYATAPYYGGFGGFGGFGYWGPCYGRRFC